MCHGSEGDEHCEENKGLDVPCFTWADSKVLSDEVTVGQKLCAVSQQVSQRHGEVCPRQRGTGCAGGPPRAWGSWERLGRESMRRTEWEAGRSGHSTFPV